LKKEISPSGKKTGIRVSEGKRSEKYMWTYKRRDVILDSKV
jgi:hypothetical protein